MENKQGHSPFPASPAEEYDPLYRRFNPVKFDADAWMRLAKEAGMKYVVFITTHHDGFSMWPTKLRPEYSIAATPFTRDICREIAAEQQHVLREMGGWLARYGESIYATRGGPFRNGEWGGATYRDRTVYLHVLKWSGHSRQFPPLKAKVLRATALAGGFVAVNQSASGITLVLPADQQDKLDTVIKLDLDAPAVAEFIDGHPLDVPALGPTRGTSPAT